MSTLLAQAASFAQEYCTGKFPNTLSGQKMTENLCTVGDLIGLFYRALHFTVMILTPAIVGFAMVCGAILVTLYGVNANYLKTGKQIIFDAFVGLVIVWGAWTIVNTAFYVLDIHLPCGAEWYTIKTCPRYYTP